MQEIEELFQLKAQAERLIREQESQPTPNQQKIDKLKALNTQFAAFIDGIDNVDKTTGVNLLSILARAAKIEEVLTDKGSYILFLDIRAGGSNRTRRNLFFGSRLRHSGSVIVNYILFDRQGAIKLSDTL
ncbi:hypothetical protein B7486_51940 [cyanobacterium TDX16]|nr:hypothetical protein B7486_51940 [cyanobacterium TDX16]